MFDYVLKGGTICDGTRKKPYISDICIKNGKIASITENADYEAKKIIDVSGKIISPGFIDIHSHSDSVPFSAGISDSKLQQGITTEIAGNCGSSPLPLTRKGLELYYKDNNLTEKTDLLAGARDSVKSYAERINKKGYISNIGMLIGHSELRINVTGYNNRKPTEEEMRQMENLLDEEMKNGCFGISFGLIYPPSAFSEREEILRLAKVVAKNDGIMAVHMRNEGKKVFEAVEEVISIAEESGVRLEISHFKIMDKSKWHKARDLTKLVEDAKARGVKVTCDQYPFLASSTALKARLPYWAQDGGMEKIREHIFYPSKELMSAIEENIESRGGAETVLIPRAPGCPQYENKFLSDIAKECGLSSTEAYIKVMQETGATARGIYFCMNEEDMLNIMSKMYVSVGTDGTAHNFDRKSPSLHPRNFGTFPKFFETVRDNKLMPIEDAVYKCTLLPATVLKIRERGQIKEGFWADITVFDYEKIKNNSEYSDSRIKPDGIEYVFVNGILALENKEVISNTAGKALLKD